MALYAGKSIKATFGATVVANLVDYSFTLDNPQLEESYLNEDWITIAGHGQKSAGGNLSGSLNTADTDGQNYIEGAVISGTKITNFQIYVNPTEYWTSDTATDPDAFVDFANFSTTGTSGDIVKFSVDFKFSGAVHKTS